MAERGVELSLGMIRDPQFGAVVTVGAGGTLVELLDDRRAALAPFGRATARRLLDGLKLRRLLDGYRGAAAADVGRLAEIVALFSVMAAELADLIAEIDVNPIVAGRHIVALTPSSSPNRRAVDGSFPAVRGAELAPPRQSLRRRASVSA